MTDLADDLLRYVNADRAVTDLRDYFGKRTYSGRRFERLGGGGDRVEIANRFTAEDLVACSTLSVNVPGRAAIAILEDRAGELQRYLQQIPVDAELWDADDTAVDELIRSDDPQGPADAAWRALDEIVGVGWVTAGKLLARKRPRLVPVYDTVVRDALGLEGGWWVLLRRALTESSDVVDRLRQLQLDAGIGTDISLLRVLDVTIWMAEQGSARPSSPAENMSDHIETPG
ncbi:MAG: hypothetical protein JJU45_08120 [Acidimicrobiia bacterium]|nr:hypothetical protein [Acidimicrobiia bacterium]